MKLFRHKKHNMAEQSGKMSTDEEEEIKTEVVKMWSDEKLLPVKTNDGFYTCPSKGCKKGRAKRLTHMAEHIECVHVDPSKWRFACGLCDARFARNPDCTRHQQKCQGPGKAMPGRPIKRRPAMTSPDASQEALSDSEPDDGPGMAVPGQPLKHCPDTTSPEASKEVLPDSKPVGAPQPTGMGKHLDDFMTMHTIALVATVQAAVGPCSTAINLKQSPYGSKEKQERAKALILETAKDGSGIDDCVKKLWDLGDFEVHLQELGSLVDSRERLLELMKSYVKLAAGIGPLVIFATDEYSRDDSGRGVGVGLKVREDASSPLEQGRKPDIYGELLLIPKDIHLRPEQLFSSLSLNNAAAADVYQMLGPLQLINHRCASH